LAELIANLILFIPLGVALTIAGVKPLRVIAAGAVLSCTVEFLQQWIPGRDPSLGDIVANTNSTALGVLLVVAAPIWLFVPTLPYRRPALGATLDQPDLRLRAALRAIAPGDTFTAATWHDSTDICLQLNSVQRCGLGYTIGDGWKLIYNPQSWPPWALALINTLWTAGCVIGVGFWGPRGDSAAIRRIAIAIAILGSLIVPLATHLNATTLYEFLGVLGGIVAGRRLARLTLKGQLDTPG